MSRYPDLTYIQAASYGPPRSQTQMIVIHATDNTADAHDEDEYSSVRTDDVSAHFYIDDTQKYQAIDTDLIAYGCYPTGNSRSVQFELCGLSNQISDATMRDAAPIVARACAQYGIPITKISSAQLVAGVKGICGHSDVTNAWHEGDHTDPGAQFPWTTFISYVQVAASASGDDMPQGLGPLPVPSTPNGQVSYSIWPVNQGAAGFGPAWLSMWGDLHGTTSAVRIALSDGSGNWQLLGTPPVSGQDPRVTLQSGKVFNTQLQTGIRGISITRLAVDVTDECTASVSMTVEYGPR